MGKRVQKPSVGLLHIRGQVLGLSFKPNTDNLREAPSLHIARTLNSLGARAVGYDPVAAKKAMELVPNLTVVFDSYGALAYEALEGAHAALIVTEWEEVRTLNVGRAAALMEVPKLLVDGRNALEPDLALEAGRVYRRVGRG